MSRICCLSSADFLLEEMERRVTAIFRFDFSLDDWNPWPTNGRLLRTILFSYHSLWILGLRGYLTFYV